MAEPLSDWKDRELAPSQLPPQGALSDREPEGALPPPLPGMASEHDGMRTPENNPTRLNIAAETIGGAVGTAVGNMRRLPANMKSRLRVVGGSAAKSVPPASEWKGQAGDKISELTGAAGVKLSEWKDTASDTASEWKEITSERIAEVSSITKRQVLQARRQAAYYTNEYPVHTILAFAGTAFVIGCALRIWRANGD